MEENANDIMETISNLGRILLYVFIGMAAFFIKRSDKSRKKTGHLESPNAEPETETISPATRPVQPKRTVKPTAVKSLPQQPKRQKYFTYEDSESYEAVKAERAKETAAQEIAQEEQGSDVDFDLRAAVIASEILKPKFED